VDRVVTNFVEFNGWMQPDKVQEVRSRARGHSEKVDFTDGQMVKKRYLLFQIVPRPFQAELDAAEAQSGPPMPGWSSPPRSTRATNTERDHNLRHLTR
jgi:multidrug efflux pump subunit AcrA (membrane-fusion protein)